MKRGGIEIFCMKTTEMSTVNVTHYHITASGSFKL